MLAKSEQAAADAAGRAAARQQRRAEQPARATDIPNDAQVCSCNNVSKGQICDAIRDKNLTSVDEIKTCTKAGTGCGGCVPLVTDLFKAADQGGRQEGQQAPVRALRLHAAGTVRDRQDQAASRRSTS